MFPTASLWSATNEIPQRADIEDVYKWNVEDIYPDLETWEKDFSFVKENLPLYKSYEGRLSESAETLLEYFKFDEKLNLISDNLYVYAYLKLDEDNRESVYQELAGRISGLNSQLGEATAFVNSELLSIDNEKLMSFLDNNSELEMYRFYFEDLIRQKKHVLSAKEESILALSEPVYRSPSRIFSMLTDADLTLGSIYDEDSNEVVLTRGRYSKFLESPDRRVRRDARHTYSASFEKLKNTLAATLGGSVKKDYYLKKARGYNSCLEMALAGDNIPAEVYNNLIEAVNANLGPLHKWTGLRKKILGYDTLYVYDLYAPLLPEQKKEYTYEEARELVLTGLKPMSKSYLENFENGLNSGWVDVYETEGKGSGAYQWGTFSSHPYVLMNFNGSLEWVFTIAHEMGHAMQDFYVNGNEPYVYHDYSLFVAEVASTCNEAVLMKHLLENTTDKKEKMALLNYYIEQIVGTFYTQVMFSEFEQAIHNHLENGGAFSADYFRKTYRDIYQKYWGPELYLEEFDDLGGMRIGHFYRQFYVYQYATSYAAAQLMSQKILAGEKGYLDKYEKFLSTGCSDYPVNVLKEAGVDMTSPETISYTIKLFGNLVDQMEKLLNES